MCSSKAMRVWFWAFGAALFAIRFTTTAPRGAIPCGQRIKQLGSRTLASRRVGRDSERSCSWDLAVRLEKEEERIAFTLVIPFKNDGSSRSRASADEDVVR